MSEARFTRLTSILLSLLCIAGSSQAQIWTEPASSSLPTNGEPYINTQDLVPPGTWKITDLGTLGGQNSNAHGINNAGAVVGSSLTADGVRHPFVYLPSPCSGLFCLAGMLDLDLASDGDLEDFIAYAIDDDYRIVGHEAAIGTSSSGPADGAASFLFHLGQSAQAARFFGLWITDIDNGARTGFKGPGYDNYAIYGDDYTWVEDLASESGNSSAGYTVRHHLGEGYVGGSASGRAFLWREHYFQSENGGAITRVAELPERIDDAYSSSGAWGITVFGSTDPVAWLAGESDKHAVLWKVQFRSNNADGRDYLEAITLTDLGTLAGDSTSAARAINRFGDAVGYSGGVGQSSQAVLWKDQIAYALSLALPENSPWSSLTSARDINDAGQIVGEGRIDTDGDGQPDANHAYLMTPCNYRFSPATISAPAAGETYTVQVKAAAGCDWRAIGNVSFVNVDTLYNEGTGDGEIVVQVSANSSTDSRVGTVQLVPDGIALRITQAGKPAAVTRTPVRFSRR